MDQLDPSALTQLFNAVIDADRMRLSNSREACSARVIMEPENAQEIAEVIRKCESDGLTLAPLGALRTLAQIRRGPADVGISLARMNQIVDYEPDDMTIVAQAGLTLGALNERTGCHGQRLPCDPPDPQLTTLGALVSAAKSGPLRL